MVSLKPKYDYFFSAKVGRQTKFKGKLNRRIYVSKLCAEGIFVFFPVVTKNVKRRSKIALFQMSAILNLFSIFFIFEKKNT